MPNELPEFDRPPVVETVLGVHFAPLVGLTSGHLGWFWREYLGEEWSQTKDAIQLQEQLEVFGAPPGWAPPGIQVNVRTLPPSPRLQITNRAGDRMVQLQSNQFHYNWQKRDGVYPSYHTVRSEFDAHFNRFREFVAQAKVGELVPIQWELTYVDHVPRDSQWGGPTGWGKVLPGLLGTQKTSQEIRLETLGGDWHYEIPPQRGRLHVTVNLGKVGEGGEPGLLLQMTARGPISKESGLDLAAGLELGHEVIVGTFMDLTSEEAHRAWGLKG
jgi:uncharacterized protein (TIGR04255 family)